MIGDKKAEFELYVLEIVAAAVGGNLERASESDLQCIADAYRVMMLQARLMGLAKIYSSLEADNEQNDVCC